MNIIKFTHIYYTLFSGVPDDLLNKEHDSYVQSGNI